jgi:hypothetical protein
LFKKLKQEHDVFIKEIDQLKTELNTLTTTMLLTIPPTGLVELCDVFI